MLTDYNLLLLAQKAYQNPPDFIFHDTQGCLFQEKEEPVIAFRGTVDPADWQRDLSLRPRYAKELKLFCHDGFLTAAEALSAQITLPVSGCLTLTGHSLGGALALLVGVLLQKRTAGRLKIKIVTFGAPRPLIRHPKIFVHSKILKKPLFFPTEIRQYHNSRDPVPDLMRCLYRHPGPLIPLGQKTVNPLKAHKISSYLQAFSQNSSPPNSLSGPHS